MTPDAAAYNVKKLFTQTCSLLPAFLPSVNARPPTQSRSSSALSPHSAPVITPITLHSLYVCVPALQMNIWKGRNRTYWPLCAIFLVLAHCLEYRRLINACWLRVIWPSMLIMTVLVWTDKQLPVLSITTNSLWCSIIIPRFLSTKAHLVLSFPLQNITSTNMWRYTVILMRIRNNYNHKDSELFLTIFKPVYVFESPCIKDQI